MSKRPHEGGDSALAKKAKSDATPSASGGSGQLSADALIAAKRAEIAAKLAAFKKTQGGGSSAPPAPASSIAAPIPNNLPPKPALPDKSDIAKKIEEAKRRVAEGVAKKAVQDNPYLSAAPSKKKGAAPVEVVQQGSGLKMAAHPLLLDTAPTQLSQSKKDRYKPMLPKFASIKANVRNQPSPSPAPTHTPTPTIERSTSATANPYASGGGAAGEDGTFEGATPAVKDRIGRSFRFNQKGKYVAMGNQIRQDAQLEALKQKIAESARKAGLDSEFETLERNIRREAPPAVEWWDASLLPNKTYDDLNPQSDSKEINLANTNIRSQDSPITMYVQHPIPVPAPWEKNQTELKPLKLTSKEAKKLRRRRRMADLQEKQDRVRMGLLPPDPPKVRLANLMKVLTTDAVQDPTKVEARVRREVAARKVAHDKMNNERKLTDEQRREKVENKKAEEERKGLFVAVFKIKTLSDPSHRFKVRKNAEQYGLTGMCIFNPSFALVIVEGSHKAIKGYKRLMLVRIDWTQAAGARDVDEDAPPPKEDQDEEGGPVSLENNRCDLVFEGPVREHNFQSFKPKRCPTDAMAKEALGTKAAPYWDTAKTFVEDVYSPTEDKSAPPGQSNLDDTDKLRKWQEERLERKLRSEYESYVRNLTELIRENTDSPARITSVKIDGTPNTRTSFLASIVNKYIPTSGMTPSLGPQETLLNALHTSRHITAALNSTGIFTSVTPTLESSSSPYAAPHDYALHFKVRERGRLFLKSSTDVGSNNDGSASITARIRNAFGGAETVEGSVAFGTQVTRSGNLRCEWPVVVGTGELNPNGDGSIRGEIGLFGVEKDETWYASVREGVKGFRASLRGHSFLGAHELAYEAAIRHIKDIDPNASLSMRQSAGYTSKSSISHTLTRDTRDDALQGTRGSYLRYSQEFAGLGGDAAFFKTESDSRYSRALGGGYTFSLSGRTGFLYPLYGRPSLFNDRFQLGGPTSLRMFRPNEMGPRDRNDSVGGDMYWAAGASIIGPFPRKPDWPLKTHLFINAGRLDTYDTKKSSLEQTARSLSTPSISAGIGLVYMLNPVRVELNFGVPIAASVSDGMRKGVQVGIGMDFL
ncbi:PRP3 protein [Rhizoctonia solani]|uniref:PRP3 protein n=2 Tax=Rhizoctonia solani TaxID=456999 RepID=A0A8H7H709_9AGAM|nr:PRP3 protein [Rhizoctonia solani]